MHTQRHLHAYIDHDVFILVKESRKGFDWQYLSVCVSLVTACGMQHRK